MYKTHPNFSRVNQEKNKTKQNDMIKRGEFDIMNIIYDNTFNLHYSILGGARGVMVIVTGIGHGDTSSNPGLIAFHIALIPLGKV